MFRIVRRSVMATCFLACVTAIARADELHYDVFVTASGTSLVIGGYDDDATVAYVPAGQLRVFGGEVVGTGTAAPYESEAPGEPGFRAASQAFLDGSSMTPTGVYTALSGSTALTFSFQPIAIDAASRNLFFWNGAGAVAFAPVGANVTLGLTKQGAGGWTSSINGASSAVVAGNVIQTTSASGGVHTHLFTEIAQDGAAPEQGFYLFALELGMNGYSSSDPLYFVFGALDPLSLAPQFADLAAFEEAHGLAEGWVETNLVAPVPEPSALALAGIGLAAVGVGALRRRARSSEKTG